MDDSVVRFLVDRAAVIDTIYRFARSLDMQDWDLCRSCFADEVEADYFDLRGTPPETLSADVFVALRREGLRGLKTQHLSSNHEVIIDGDSAICRSYMLIFRYRPGEGPSEGFHTHGYYRHTLTRSGADWKISRVKQSVFWNTGDPRVHGALR